MIAVVRVRRAVMAGVVLADGEKVALALDVPKAVRDLSNAVPGLPEAVVRGPNNVGNGLAVRAGETVLIFAGAGQLSAAQHRRRCRRSKSACVRTTRAWNRWRGRSR